MAVAQRAEEVGVCNFAALTVSAPLLHELASGSNLTHAGVPKYYEPAGRKSCYKAAQAVLRQNAALTETQLDLQLTFVPTRVGRGMDGFDLRRIAMKAAKDFSPPSSYSLEDQLFLVRKLPRVCHQCPSYLHRPARRFHVVDSLPAFHNDAP